MKTAAVIGCGRAVPGKEGFAIGHAHGGGYKDAYPDIELIGVDINPDNLKAFGEAFGVPDERLFDSTEAMYAAQVPDAVSICTWPPLHMPLTVEAAEAGVKAICCEKPMATDIGLIDAMMQACERQGARLAIAHQRCYEAPFIKLKQLLQAGAIGEKLILQGSVGDGWDIQSWTVHWFDMARFVFDQPATAVFAGIDHTGSRRYGHAVEDASTIIAEFGQDKHAHFLTGPNAMPQSTGVSVVGEYGMAVLVADGVEIYNQEGFEKHAGDDQEFGGFAALFRDLWKSVQDPSYTSETDASHTSAATRMAFAAHESARTMRRIELPVHHLDFAPLEVAQRPVRRIPDCGKVVLLGDKHHIVEATGEGGREGLRDALHRLGFDEVHVVPVDEREPKADDLEGAELLVIYHTQRTSSPAVRELLTGWIGAGKPTVVTHCGIGAYDDWPQFRQWMGRHWVWGDDAGVQGVTPSGHPHVPCAIQITPGTGFDPGFVTAQLPRDEVYVDLYDSAPVKELATASYDDGKTASIAWQAEGVENVIVWAPGHLREVWSLEPMTAGLAACIRAVL